MVKSGLFDNLGFFKQLSHSFRKISYSLLYRFNEIIMNEVSRKLDFSVGIQNCAKMPEMLLRA